MKLILVTMGITQLYDLEINFRDITNDMSIGLISKYHEK